MWQLVLLVFSMKEKQHLTCAMVTLHLNASAQPYVRLSGVKNGCHSRLNSLTSKVVGEGKFVVCGIATTLLNHLLDYNRELEHSF